MTPTNLTVTPENVAEVAKAIARKRYGNVQIKPVSTLDAGLVMGLFGRGGAGKTTLAASITDSPLGAPALLLNCFGNPHVVSSYADRLDVAEITKFSEVEAIVKDIETDPNCRYKSLIYDNVTAMIMLRLRELYGATADVDWTKHSATTADVLQLALNGLMLSAGRHKMNVLFLFQLVTEERTINGVKGDVYEIAANKAVQSQFPGLVSFLGRIYIKGEIKPFHRMLDFTPLEKLHQAKMQFDPKHPTAGTIPLEIYKPSMASLLDTLRGNQPFPIEKHRESLQK